MLHNETELFQQLILMVHEDTGIEPSIIEKDYHVTAFLKLLVKKQPQIIFKGGTSLSKCYKLIERFSEDIDLNLECKTHPTVGERKQLKQNIIATIDEFQFTLTNGNDIKSRRDYNKYIVNFPSAFDSPTLKQSLIVETSVFLRAYPTNKMAATSLIYDYLQRTQRDDMIERFALAPFEINVQDIRRTLIDKLFAVGDYYLANKTVEHSRHIYDLYKLYDVVSIDAALKDLYETVKAERKSHLACLSAQEGISLKILLQEIVSTAAYKNDYETLTAGLLFEKISYDTAVAALQKIVDSGLFDEAP